MNLVFATCRQSLFLHYSTWSVIAEVINQIACKCKELPKQGNHEVARILGMASARWTQSESLDVNNAVLLDCTNFR